MDGIMENLDRIFARVRPTEVVAPLLPIHIDHALLRAAAERLTTRCSSWHLLYYEDQPYSALWPRSLAREVAPLIKLEESYGAVPEEAVESLFQKLQALVQQRDLERILKHRKSCMPYGVESLWSARPGL
jgi:LmbE family N-acetylglucosaminyl deacetylase